jgi:beta-phosphoglucomutase
MDMDGVLIDSPKTHVIAWRKALSTVQIDVTDLEVLIREGGSDKEILAEIAQSKNTELTRQQIDQVCNLKRQLFEDLFELKSIEGILDFVNELNLRGCRLALVTGTIGTTANKLLQALSIETKFEAVITADILKFSKPHPEPYVRAMELLREKPGNSIVIENAPAGILSAKRAGLTCTALTTSLPARYLQGADFIFQDVLTLRNWFFSSS